MRAGEPYVMDDLLYEAIYRPEGVDPYPRDIIRLPAVNVYIHNFGSLAGDHCLVAESKQSVIVGGVWTRLLSGQTKTYEYVEASIPELGIGIFPEYRSRGTGGRLMQAMIMLLQENGYAGVCLSVDRGNYAVGMYRKLGFAIVGENTVDYIMELRFA